MNENLPAITELRRLPSALPTPQALAWRAGKLWISSRDTRCLWAVDTRTWTAAEAINAPGIVWGAVAAWDAIYCVSGEGDADDRYLRRYGAEEGFDAAYRVPVPEFTGSYLSFDGQHLYMSQWYKRRVLQLDTDGQVRRTVDVGEEICGHAFVDGELYVLRGTEQEGERWHVARMNLREEAPRVEEIAHVPFPCRSLVFDGEKFWTNHRAANQTVAFALPGGE